MFPYLDSGCHHCAPLKQPPRKEKGKRMYCISSRDLWKAGWKAGGRTEKESTGSAACRATEQQRLLAVGFHCEYSLSPSPSSPSHTGCGWNVAEYRQHLFSLRLRGLVGKEAREVMRRPWSRWAIQSTVPLFLDSVTAGWRLTEVCLAIPA